MGELTLTANGSGSDHSQPTAVQVQGMITATPAAEHVDSTVTLIGGAAAAVALLAFLFFASRPSTRAHVRAVVGKAFGSARSLQSTPPSTASTAAANTSPAAASSEVPISAGAGKGVLLDGSARQRSGLSWYRPARVQLLAAPKQDGAPGAPAWSALVLNGVAVPYEEVAGVRMDENKLEFIVEHNEKHTHLRMFTRSEFNLWREALNPKITNPTRHVNSESTPSAVHVAQKWL